MTWPGRITALLLALVLPAAASAQERRLEIHFTPTARMTYALWVTSADGEIFETIRLTEAVGRYGIGNRPGALQMNSAFRWPYGRREGALPIWSHARIAAGGEPFRRVIFQARTEGFASTEVADSSRDDFFCLSFTPGDEMLDAMSCASIFNSDKGRFITASDVSTLYSEPFETAPSAGMMRPLSMTSVYPPRRDLAGTCDPGSGCLNHPDVLLINEEARRVIPNIDVITRPTPSANVAYEVVFEVPDTWPEGAYQVWLEANTEGDHNPNYDPRVMPTPSTPSERWDSWARTYGYPYRGQPSVVYRVDVTLDGTFMRAVASQPIGYSDVHGRDGTLRPMDTTMTDDPAGHPGSGADRLQAAGDGSRLVVEIPATNICGGAMPPPECNEGCSESRPCPAGFICGDAAMCVGMCDIERPPAIIPDVAVVPHPDEKQAHQYAVLSFTVPTSERLLRSFDVRFSTEPIVDEDSFVRARPARRAVIESEDLVIPVAGIAAGDRIEVEMGGMSPSTHYFVAIRALDECRHEGSLAVAEVSTTPIHFTTVSPCFVATAAYGTPMSEEIRVLRRFRDRHLLSNGAGRAAVSAYETVGPPLAELIRGDETLRAAARAALSPWVALARSLDRS